MAEDERGGGLFSFVIEGGRRGRSPGPMPRSGQASGRTAQEGGG